MISGLIAAITDEAAIGPRTEYQSQCIEQDGFASARFARQNGKTASRYAAEIEVQSLDQHNIAYG
jgi:hypothetical protein